MWRLEMNLHVLRQLVDRKLPETQRVHTKSSTATLHLAHCSCNMKTCKCVQNLRLSALLNVPEVRTSLGVVCVIWHPMSKTSLHGTALGSTLLKFLSLGLKFTYLTWLIIAYCRWIDRITITTTTST